jgi:predicted Zn-dependent protease
VDPKHPRLALNIALVEIQLKDFNSALRALDVVEASAGASTVTHYLRARAYLESGDVTAAQPSVDRFRAAEPQDPEAFLGLARLLISSEAYREAAELLLGLTPERQNLATRFSLGQAFYALDQMERAREVFEGLSASNPDNPLYWTWCGHARRALGSVAEARLAYQKAIAGAGVSAAEALTELSSLELDAGNTEEAEALSARALAETPDDSRTRFVAGQVYIRQQRWADAVRLLEEIAPQALEYAQAQYMLSRAFLQSGQQARAEAALAEFQRTAASSPPWKR